jgi:hypothetical protein
MRRAGHPAGWPALIMRARGIHSRGADSGPPLARAEEAQQQLCRDSPARGKVREGDVIEEVALGGGPPQRPASAAALYEAVGAAEPGTKVTLTARTGPGQPRQVTLPVGQGADEGQPLFSLFVTREVDGQRREWIGWNPAGPYDSGAPESERLIDWHFNPTDPSRLACAFASGSQYRKEYRREGILKYPVAPARGKWIRARRRGQPRPPLLTAADSRYHEARSLVVRLVTERETPTMAANLTPQYLEAEAEYKKARTPDERLACLQKMWSLLPNTRRPAARPRMCFSHPGEPPTTSRGASAGWEGPVSGEARAARPFEFSGRGRPGAGFRHRHAARILPARRACTPYPACRVSSSLIHRLIHRAAAVAVRVDHHVDARRLAGGAGPLRPAGNPAVTSPQHSAGQGGLAAARKKRLLVCRTGIAPMPEAHAFQDLIRRVRGGDNQAAAELVRRFEVAQDLGLTEMSHE